MRKRVKLKARRLRKQIAFVGAQHSCFFHRGGKKKGRTAYHARHTRSRHFCMAPPPPFRLFLDTWSCVPRVETRLEPGWRRSSDRWAWKRKWNARLVDDGRVLGRACTDRSVGRARVWTTASRCASTHATHRVLHTGLPDYRINISDDIARAHL